ncbi:ankyrin repeat-containing domain, PGG domain protein [Artemisia annua]|uniref:Ankyrin repeat-containing domain, PGG domain protein n=1 Tax=Artemisia annua TaxID=35608 RepID=A0A2U1PKH3_ARTAN|nr:ankyrin repeat-containing domain, PGG domain protein [Artemisia annua]
MSTDLTISRPTLNLPNQDLLNGAGKKDYFEYGAPLYEASIHGDWKAAKAILDKKPELVRYSLTQNGETALHVAASANRSKQVVTFVKNLVDLMENEDLELVNKNYNTALYLAAAAGNLETIEIMMAKNKILHTIPGAHGIMMPLYAAALFGSHKVVKYLYDNSNELRDDAWTDMNRGWLPEKCVESDMFGIALDIVRKHPTLGRNNALLGVLARKPGAFLKTKSSILKGTVYSVCAFIGLKVEMPEKESQALQLLRILWEDIVKFSKKEIDDILRGPKDYIKSESGRVLPTVLQQLIFEHLEKMERDCQGVDEVMHLKSLVSQHVVNMHLETQNIILQDNKTLSGKGDQPLEIQKTISEYIMRMSDETQKLIKYKEGEEDLAVKLQELISKNITTMHRAMRRAISLEKHPSRVLFIAAEMGNTNFIVELILRYPDLIWKVNDQNLSIFHVAVKHRHAGIYNLLYEIGAMKDMITPLIDENGNNMLHLVGMTVNRKQVENVSGGALEMQRELLWFQEVESIVPPSYRERRNSDGLTPHEVFTKEHKDMVTQGEKWVKEIASQCMVVAALIATMVFAAAFTVPGGYDQNNGIPIFHSKTTFKVFVVANAISLFSSSASILYMFLSVFTSRYAERDFLESVPRKLIIGMSYLFLSMTTMMIAFSVSFFVLYQKGLLWIPILISGFALIPFGIYVKAQYFLFIEMIRSTYHSKYIFKPKKHVLYYKNPTV